MDERACYVFGAGEYFRPLPVPGGKDFVIAADGGFEYLKTQNIDTDLVVGDFDSLHEVPAAANVVVLSQESDDADMLVALQAGFARGYRTFHIYGGTGGRFDHTMANIQSLAYLTSVRACGFLYDKSTVITTVQNGRIRFPSSAKGRLSVFAFTDEAEGVNGVGLKYPLVNATLRSVYPLGLSNEFTGRPSTVSVASGIILVVYPHDVTPISVEFGVE